MGFREAPHIRRRRDDQNDGGPDPHWCLTWGQYCEERGIRDLEAVFQVMDGAKAMAERRETAAVLEVSRRASSTRC